MPSPKPANPNKPKRMKTFVDLNSEFPRNSELPIQRNYSNNSNNNLPVSAHNAATSTYLAHRTKGTKELRGRIRNKKKTRGKNKKLNRKLNSKLNSKLKRNKKTHASKIRKRSVKRITRRKTRGGADGAAPKACLKSEAGAIDDAIEAAIKKVEKVDQPPEEIINRFKELHKNFVNPQYNMEEEELVENANLLFELESIYPIFLDEFNKSLSCKVDISQEKLKESPPPVVELDGLLANYPIFKSVVPGLTPKDIKALVEAYNGETGETKFIELIARTQEIFPFLEPTFFNSADIINIKNINKNMVNSYYRERLKFIIECIEKINRLHKSDKSDELGKSKKYIDNDEILDEIIKLIKVFKYSWVYSYDIKPKLKEINKKETKPDKLRLFLEYMAILQSYNKNNVPDLYKTLIKLTLFYGVSRYFLKSQFIDIAQYLDPKAPNLNEKNYKEFEYLIENYSKSLPDPVSEDMPLTPDQIAELNRRNTDNFFGFAAAVANKYNMKGAKEYLEKRKLGNDHGQVYRFFKQEGEKHKRPVPQ